MKKVLAIILTVSTLFTFAGCGTPDIPETGIEGLSWGMTKEEVFEVLGESDDVEFDDNYDYFEITYDEREFLDYSCEYICLTEVDGTGDTSLYTVFIDIGGFGTEYAGKEEEVYLELEEMFNKKFEYIGEDGKYKKWKSENSLIALSPAIMDGFPVFVEFTDINKESEEI